MVGTSVCSLSWQQQLLCDFEQAFKRSGFSQPYVPTRANRQDEGL